MNFTETKLDHVCIISPTVFNDERGFFVKTFHEKSFKDRGLECDFKESFFSESKRDVIRGMHFQAPPHDHAKLIYVTHGSIVDVVLDVRKSSPCYGDYISEELSYDNKKMMYVPRGCAHGFSVLSDVAVVVYLQSTMHDQEHDSGILWDSFGMKWDIPNPIISGRDRGFPPLKKFISPFK